MREYRTILARFLWNDSRREIVISRDRWKCASRRSQIITQLYPINRNFTGSSCNIIANINAAPPHGRWAQPISHTGVHEVFEVYCSSTCPLFDSGQVSALCLLDLTAAFDTVDHDLLMLRLERQFGFCGVVLQWFRSYLSDRSFRVVLSTSTSFLVHLFCSVPQGSVLGPCLLYMADLADVVQNCHLLTYLLTYLHHYYSNEEPCSSS